MRKFDVSSLTPGSTQTSDNVSGRRGTTVSTPILGPRQRGKSRENVYDKILTDGT